MRDQQERGGPWRSTEFWLVFLLVIALIGVIAMIFSLIDGQDRKDLLGMILGAFGAWIGAGAAYFFGRENLREATNSMLRMRGVSPQERLMQTTLRDLRPKPLPRTITPEDTVRTVMNWFEEEPERFFVVVLNDQGRVENVVHEEAIYRYLSSQAAQQLETARDHDLKTVIAFIEDKVKTLKDDKKPDAAKSIQSLVHAAVTIEGSQTAFVANEIMEQEKKFVTVVVDAKEAPLGYITTADIRRLLLSSP